MGAAWRRMVVVGGAAVVLAACSGSEDTTEITTTEVAAATTPATTIATTTTTSTTTSAPPTTSTTAPTTTDPSSPSAPFEQLVLDHNSAVQAALAEPHREDLRARIAQYTVEPYLGRVLASIDRNVESNRIEIAGQGGFSKVVFFPSTYRVIDDENALMSLCTELTSEVYEVDADGNRTLVFDEPVVVTADYTFRRVDGRWFVSDATPTSQVDGATSC